MKKLAKLEFKALRAWFRIGGAIAPRLTAKVAYRRFFSRPARHKPQLKDLDLIGRATVIIEEFEDRIIYGYEWGNNDDYTKTILLVHGWSSHALTMRLFIGELLKHNFRVVAFDAPGHGNSQGKNINGIQYRLFLAKLLTKYMPDAVIAHSLGGICSLSALADQASLANSKAVILSAPISSETLIRQFIRIAKLHKRSQHHFYRNLEKYVGANSVLFDLSRLYPDGIKHPGMIIHDRNDKVIPYVDGVALSKLWKNAQFVTTTGLGHSGVLKDAAVIKQVVDFIVGK